MKPEIGTIQAKSARWLIVYGNTATYNTTIEGPPMLLFQTVKL